MAKDNDTTLIKPALTSSNEEYNAKSIQVLEGLDAIRKRPGMYIGDNGVNGLHHLIWEVVDNSIDEVMNGYATEIKVHLGEDNYVTIEDNGRGIPIDIHPKYKKPAVELLFSSLHSGGKFDNKAYKTSGGLHGVGLSVLNALSDKLEVTIQLNKIIYQIIFSYGGREVSKLKEIGTTTNHGTKIRFLPSFAFFTCKEFDSKKILDNLRKKAFLNSKLKIIFQDKNNKPEELYYENGLLNYIEYLTSNNKKIGNPISYTHADNDFLLNISIQYTTSSSENILSFANNVHTINGGTHELGFKLGQTRAFLEFLKEKKVKTNKIEGQDIRTGLNVIIDLRVPEKFIQYEGQTKSKLSSPEARIFVENTVYSFFKYYLIENRENSDKILNSIIKASELREEVRKQRNIAKIKINNANNNDYANFSGKLVNCQSRNNKITELFLVEGDSAGGSAKQGRDNKYQAILPLKGKVINAERSNLVDLLKNDEILTIIHAIGCGIGEDFNIDKIKYNKIIIMTDADVDGAHIQTLLLTFFFKYMKPLILNHNLFIAKPPLFKLQNHKNPKEIYYIHDESELEPLKDKLGNKNLSSQFTLQRYKGLGEMNAEQLWETTMDPNTRHLINVQISDDTVANLQLVKLMGSDSDGKKEWIENNVSFTPEEVNKLI